MKNLNFQKLYTKYKESSLHGRYIIYSDIEPIIQKWMNVYKVETVGKSENNLPIPLITLGSGPKKILLWSQMHGDESTTTRAIFDLLNTLHHEHELSNEILSQCTLYIVPMLNPDGAQLFTRLNYNKIDLNRDSQNLTQKESKILNQLVKDIKPDYGFNLHGQPNVYSVGFSKKSAVMSFLSPAGDKNKTITEARKKGMEIIAHMNDILQEHIPNQVGRYNDSFNINCIGDTLSSMDIACVLFEAGHYPNDYDREKTRTFMYYALLSSINYISSNTITGSRYKEYYNIPQNEKLFFDLLIKSTIFNKEKCDFGINYEHKIENKKLKFIPKIQKIGNLNDYHGHREIEANERLISHTNGTNIEIGQELNSFYLDNDQIRILNTNIIYKD